MTAQLSLVPEPAEPDPPALVEYRGQPITWMPWEPGVPVTHIDTTCQRCGRDLGSQATAAGTLPEHGRAVPPRRRGYACATTPAVYQVRVLMAARAGASCTPRAAAGQPAGVGAAPRAAAGTARPRPGPSTRPIA
ncbi:hypothetical protein WEH80_01405 [Actinomycetes bacterium KLBMP 9759]